MAELDFLDIKTTGFVWSRAPANGTSGKPKERAFDWWSPVPLILNTLFLPVTKLSNPAITWDRVVYRYKTRIEAI